MGTFSCLGASPVASPASAAAKHVKCAHMGTFFVCGSLLHPSLPTGPVPLGTKHQNCTCRHIFGVQHLCTLTLEYENTQGVFVFTPNTINMPKTACLWCLITFCLFTFISP